ncbi:MAG: CdaR family protein, partial [Clostridia bacterium]|nr:CdaR family protein [Clostridia bacterium]
SLKVISLIVAIILWVFAIRELNPERTQNITNIPVEIINLDQLNRKELTLVKDPPQVVTIRIRGLLNDIYKMNDDNLKAVLDLSDIDWTGTQNMELEIEGLIREISLERIPEVPVTINRIINKPIPVKIEVIGNGADGFYVHEATAEPPSVTIYGAQSLVDSVVQGVVRVKLDQDEGTIKQSLPIDLVDSTGNIIKSEYLKLRQDSTMVTIPIHPVKTFDIRANIVGNPADGFVIDDIIIDPSQVTINGYASIVNRLTSLLTEPIDINNADEDVHATVNLAREDGIYLEPGQPSKVNVVINISETIIDAELLVNEAELRNIPEGFEAAVDPLSISVQLRGPYTHVQQLSSQGLDPHVDLSQINTEEEGFEPGMFELPLVLNVPGTVEIIGVSNETVTVNLQPIVEPVANMEDDTEPEP